MRILLTGFMGSGKSTVGERLARRLGVAFVDLDSEIQARTGVTIREFFERRGEPEFRRVERLVFEEVLQFDPVVIAVGGGTLVDPVNLEAARARGLVVWLNPSFATIAQRIGAFGKADRPLFPDEKTAFDLYRRRLESYRQSDMRVDVAAEEDAEQVAARLALLLAERTCSS